MYYAINLSGLSGLEKCHTNLGVATSDSVEIHFLWVQALIVVSTSHIYVKSGRAHDD